MVNLNYKLHMIAKDYFRERKFYLLFTVQIFSAPLLYCPPTVPEA
jgi:hypothetical protein